MGNSSNDSSRTPLTQSGSDKSIRYRSVFPYSLLLKISARELCTKNTSAEPAGVMVLQMTTCQSQNCWAASLSLFCFPLPIRVVIRRVLREGIGRLDLGGCYPGYRCATMIRFQHTGSLCGIQLAPNSICSKFSRPSR